MVDDKGLYFTAGNLATQGTCTFAVNPRTGKVEWKFSSKDRLPDGYIFAIGEKPVLTGLRNSYICTPPTSNEKLSLEKISYNASYARWVEGAKTDATGFQDGFVVHGRKGSLKRGYRSNAGYCNRVTYKNSFFKMSTVPKKNGMKKIPDISAIGDSGSFLPIFSSDHVFLRHQEALVSVARKDIFGFVTKRKHKGPSAGPIIKWYADNLPCGIVQWLVLGKGGGDKDLSKATLIAGGNRGVSAVRASDGKVQWSVAWNKEGPSLPPAIADGRIYVTTPEGHVRALAPQRD